MVNLGEVAAGELGVECRTDHLNYAAGVGGFGDGGHIAPCVGREGARYRIGRLGGDLFEANERRAAHRHRNPGSLGSARKHEIAPARSFIHSVPHMSFVRGEADAAFLKKRFGASVMGEVLEQTVNETSGQALQERNLRPAMQPNIEILSFNEGKDLEYKLAVEVLPEIGSLRPGRVVKLLVEVE